MVTTTKLMSIEQLEREGAPEGRYELIDGELVEMSPSDPLPSRIAILFASFLVNHVLPRDLGGVFGAEAGFAIFPDRQTVRVPDVAFVSKERLPPVTARGFLPVRPGPRHRSHLTIRPDARRHGESDALARCWGHASSGSCIRPPARSPSTSRVGNRWCSARTTS